jgi:hypothetical protein
MLVDAIDVLSGDRYTYFVMSMYLTSPQHVIQHFSRFELKTGDTLPETIVLKVRKLS